MATPELIRTQILALVKEYHAAKFAPKTFDPEKDLGHYAGRVFDAEEMVPVFVDVNLGDYTAIPERLAAAIGPKTKAVLMAHTMGVPFHLDAVIVFQVDGEEDFNLWHKEMTLRNMEAGQSVAYVHLKKWRLHSVIEDMTLIGAIAQGEKSSPAKR